jgi:hypothetical protein
MAVAKRFWSRNVSPTSYETVDSPGTILYTTSLAESSAAAGVPEDTAAGASVIAGAVVVAVVGVMTGISVMADGSVATASVAGGSVSSMIS